MTIKHLQFGNYDDQRNEYICSLDNCGLGAILNSILVNLVFIHKNLTKKPIRIYWPSEWYNKHLNGIPDKTTNTFEMLFNQCDNSEDILLDPNTEFDMQEYDYAKRNHNLISVLVNKYFTLKDEIITIQSNIIKKYGIDFDKTVVVHYRGTDKITEAPRIHPSYYLKCFNDIKQKIDLTNYRVLIQTDQKQVLDFLKQKIERSYSVDVLPVTEGERVLHQIANIDRTSFVKNYLATLYIISKCKYIVYDTGNGTKWITVIRGGCKNTYQLQAELKIYDHFGCEAKST